MENKINWFPGHMQKSVHQIRDSIANVDFILEIVDARAIKASSNTEISQIISSKPNLKIALKSDLAFFSKNESHDENLIFASIKNKSDRLKIINAIKKCCEKIISKKTKQGYKEIKLNGMVVGLPNVGKSSLINFLSEQKKVISQNKPGVTRKLSWVKIDKNFFIMDTPGIFIKNVIDQNEGYKLVLINTVKSQVVMMHHVLEFAYNYYNEHFFEEFKNFVDHSVDDSFSVFIEKMCVRFNLYLPSQTLDLERAMTYFHSFINSKKMFKISYDLF